MKYYLFFFSIIILYSCNKTYDVLPSSLLASKIADSKGGGNGGGGGVNNSGLIQSVLSGTASRLVSTKTDSILVSFTQAAPAGGWTLQLTSSDPSAVQIAPTYFVPAGSSVVHPNVTAGNIANAKNATITVKLLSQAKTTVLKVFPLTATFPAPQLLSPSNGKSFKSREIVTFDWNDNNNAYYSHLQISLDKAFTNLATNLLLDESIWPQSFFNGTGTIYWRIAFVDASGNDGPWSEVRNFIEKPQQ